MVVGRRGGKSRVLAVTATFLACVPDHSAHLSPGETPVIAVIAQDRRQAQIILSYVVGALRASDLFAEMIVDVLAESVLLTNGVLIEVHTASIGAPRGRTFIAVLGDECAYWPVGDSANPDVEVINAVRPGLATIPYSLLLVASSPYAKRGLLYQNYAKYFGRDDAPVLVWQGTTEEMNASLVGDPLIAEMYAEDPERASAEFGAQFRSDIVAFITREAVKDCLARNVREIPASGAITYVGHVDPSGGSADSMTLAVAHLSAEGTAVLDAIREVKPPFSPDAVVEEFATLLKSYGIVRVTGDAYAGEWPRERFAVHGIAYDVSKKNTSTIYGEFLPALNGRRVQLLDLPRLVGQLVGLVRYTARAGRDRIAHAPGSHDDVANVVCGALVQVIEDRRPTLITQTDLLTDDLPAIIQHPQAFQCIVWVTPDGQCAVTVFSHEALTNGGARLVLEWFDTAPWTFGLLLAAAKRMDDLCEIAYARSNRVKESGGCCAFMLVQQQLLQPATAAMRQVFAEKLEAQFYATSRMRNVDALAISPAYGADSARLVLSAAGHVASGSVKLSAEALALSGGKPLLGSLAVRPGEAVDADPLRMAMLIAIAQLDAEWADAEGASVRFG